MPLTTLANSLSLVTQPQGAQGCHIVVYISSYTLASLLTNGVTVTGNTVAATGVTENINVTSNVAAQNSQVGRFEYVTQNAFISVTSITVNSTLVSSGGQMEVRGVLAAKNSLPCDIEVKGPGFTYYSPNEKRGSMERNFAIVQLNKKVSVGKLDQSLYPNTSLFWPLCLINSIRL